MSEAEFEKAVRELGGTEEDLKMLADADFSGSDWEDSESQGVSQGLEADVAKLWSELSGGKEKPVMSTKSDLSNKSNSKKLDEAEMKSKKETKASRSESEDTAKSLKETKKTKDSKVSSKEIAKNNMDSKQSNNRSNDIKKVPKPKQIQMSKKDKVAWESYISSLHHPDSLLIEDKSWVDLADIASKRAEVLPEFIDQLKHKSQVLLNEEIAMYFEQRKRDREFTSSLDFLKKGTFGDQLGTLSILSTESPLHSVTFLENLGSKCEIKNRESACKALEVTKDLIVSHILPDRRLRWFKDQPVELGTPMETLIAWSFEDFLKKYFFKLLQTLERLLADTVENIRTRTLHCVFDLFQQKPEQEANLLRLGLNKLGDPAGKVASRVKKLLMDALQLHPGMKPIVALAMEETLSRTNDYRLRYYAVDTLNEFILSNKEPQLANKLIHIYLNLFERLLNESKDNKDQREDAPVTNGKPKSGKRFRAKRGKKGGIQQKQLDMTETENQQYARLVAKLFTGLNRAYPFSNLDSKLFSKHIDTMYQMSHSPNVGTFIEALSFIFQLSKTAGGSGFDRYYRSLYESLLDSRLPHSSKFAKYIHLLMMSTARFDRKEEVHKCSAFIKRNLQVACNLSEVGAAASLIHVASLTPGSHELVSAQRVGSEQQPVSDEYDPKQRDPRFAKAETSQAWEIVLLQQHYHPTVSLYANNMLMKPDSKQALDMPDIEQYSINQFLNKWAYKKPKAKESTRGGSIFQPLPGFTDLNLGVQKEKRQQDDLPASLRDWKNKNVASVAPEERFLYEYFAQRPDRKPKTKPANNTATKDSDDDISEFEDLAEDEINEVMSKSGPSDYENIELNMSSASDDEEDGDLETELANAFNSDSDSNSDAGEPDDIGIEGDDDENENDSVAFDDFVDFDTVGETMEVDGKDSSSVDNNDKKRKRWSQYPAFMDADAFEEMISEKSTNKKRNSMNPL